MTITTYDPGILTAVKSAKAFEFAFAKAAPATENIDVPDFYWRMAGSPLAGAVPATGAGTIPTRITTGAIPMPDIGGSDKRFLVSFGIQGGVTAVNSSGYWLVDVLWMNSGLNGTLTTAQTINSTALTRYTDGIGNWLGLICWTATGSTASNVTVSYTDDGDVSRTSTSQGFFTSNFGIGTGAPQADQMQFLQMDAASKGIKSIQSLTLSASTLTAGDFGCIMIHPIAMIPGNNNFTGVAFAPYKERDFVLQSSNLPEIKDEACLALIGIPNATTGLAIQGRILTIDG